MEHRLLTLVRHGKSSWQTPGMSDHDRPLNDRGMRDAPDMAKRLLDRQCIPDLILCSSARRTQETASYFVETLELEKAQLVLFSELYLASPATIVRTLQNSAANANHVMIIGHNPGMEDLSSLLCSDCQPAMPTSGVRHFSYSDLAVIRQLVSSDTQGASPSHQPKDVALVFEDYPKNT